MTERDETNNTRLGLGYEYRLAQSLDNKAMNTNVVNEVIIALLERLINFGALNWPGADI